MNVSERRDEIISILIVRRHATTNELAYELGVSVRTIEYDIQALSFRYPIYTKPGVAGGIFMSDTYKPYTNSLTPKELKILIEVYEESEDERRETFAQILHKYGPDKLEL